MKNFLLVIAISVFGFTNAQNKNPKLEDVNGKVKATYYYDNGSIEQVGFFSNGKLDGKWTSYDINGNVTAVAQYSNGDKVGNWTFSSSSDMTAKEVVYIDNNISEVRNLKNNSIVNKE